MDSTQMDSLQEHLDLLLAQSSLYREEGKYHIRNNDLVAARLCYIEALNYLVPKFESLKDDLLKRGFDINLSDCVSKEIAMIFGNRSLVMLKEGDIGMAIQDAQQSLDYFPTAKGYFRLAEARCCAGDFMGALQLFSESYSLKNNTVTYCKYFVLAVHIGMYLHVQVSITLEPLDSYTPVIERLITLHEFRVIHLEILLLPKCKAVPKLKTGIATNKCSTACIKNLSEIMMQTGWKLVEALIEHGTVPDIKCIEVATEKYGEDRTLYLTQCIEEKTKHNNICYNSLLSKAIRKKWNDRFVHHCLERGAKFAAEDVWTVLKKWSHDSRKHNLLKVIASQDGAMDIQNDKGQLPLDFLLEQGMFNVALVLLEFKIDCNGIDIIKTIKSVKKYDANRHPIFKILGGIIENKKQPPDLLIQELTSALKYAFTNNRYDVAAMLIDHGADISSCVENSTNVHVATKIVLHVNGRIGILKSVLDSYSFPEDGKVIDKDGQLPHHLAVADNTAQSEAVLKLLFQYSAKFDLETKNKDGNTALSCCRRKREHLKKLLEAEIDRLKSSSGNVKDNFRQQQKQDDKQDTKSKSTEPAAKESTELSMHELTEAVKRKVDSVLKSDHRLQEISEYGHKLKEEPLKKAKGMPSNAAITIAENTSRKEKEKKRFEECTWEVECTETFWKELSKQEKPLKEMVFSKLHRLANGEWHEKFHKPLSGTKCKKLYELKVDDSVSIIWERAIAYSPRLSLKDSSQNKPAELYTEVIRVWSLVVNHDHISTHVKQIQMANIKGQGSLIKEKPSSCDQVNLVSNPIKRIPHIYQVCTRSVTDKDAIFFPPANAKDNEYNIATFYSISGGFTESILKHEDRRDFPFKQHGADWERLGLELGLSKDDIASISKYNEHHPRKLKMCFTAVLEQCFPDATQDKVDNAIKECRSLVLQNYHHTNQLWTQDNLHQIIFATTKEDVPLPENMETEVLQSVLVVLVAVSINGTLATHCYLQPLDKHEYIYRFEFVDQGGQSIIYYIGKYGACPVAIRGITSTINMLDSANIKPMMTDRCFPNLTAIISVGVISGVRRKVKLCDVLVSSEIINCEKSTDSTGYLSKREKMTASSQLIKLLTEVQWPNDEIKKRLKDNGMLLPNIIPGVILSLPQIIDDPALVTVVPPTAIGIEMEGGHLFAEAQQTMVDTIMVKAVSGFLDGKNSDEYQSTAALVAVDLVYKSLSSHQTHEAFKAKSSLCQMIQQAKDEGLTINVRHAKILFCGASHAGKTSFARLLTNQKHDPNYNSTPSGDAQQVLISGEKVNVVGTNWIVLDSKTETKELTKRLIAKLQSQEDFDTNDELPLNYSEPHLAHHTEAENKPPPNEKKKVMTKVSHNVNPEIEKDIPGSPSRSVNDNNHSKSFTNKSELSDKNSPFNTRISTEKTMADHADIVNSFTSGSIPKTWDLFTLLDTGGQPEFINMLPAINASTAITFVVLNMSDGRECLDKLVIAQYKCEGYNYSTNPLKYTNMHLLKCLLSSVKVASSKEDIYFHPKIIKKISEPKQTKPVVCIIGTFADKLKEKYGDEYNEEVSKINVEVKKLIKKENMLEFWCNAGRNYVISVDNTISRESQKVIAHEENLNMRTVKQETAVNIQRLCENSNEILKSKVQYEIPISWFILELELRNNDKTCIPLTEVEEICNRIMPLQRKLKIEQIKEILKFYHLYGMLLYFSEVDGMNNFVITNPQWLFVNLTKILMCRFKNNANGLYGAHHIEQLHNGICHIELLRKLTLDLQGVKLESFLNLLVHFKIIIPLWMDDAYLMPTLLPPCSEEYTLTEKEYGKPIAFKVDGRQYEVEPLFIEFTFGTIPRGFFGFLVVQLLQDNQNTFELYGENDNNVLRRCSDMISFYIKPCWYISLRDRISFLELQVTVKDNLPSYHYKAQTAVTKALKKVCDKFNWKLSDCHYGFLCHEHVEDSHLALLFDDNQPLPVLSTNQPFSDNMLKYAYCRSQQATCLSMAHSIWFKDVQEVSKQLGDGRKDQAADDDSGVPAVDRLTDTPAVTGTSPTADKLSEKPKMWKLRKLVVPEVKACWDNLAFSMEYEIPQVEAIKRDGKDVSEQCATKLFQDWLETSHGCTPKTWRKLLERIKDVDELYAAADRIKEKLLEAK